MFRECEHKPIVERVDSQSDASASLYASAIDTAGRSPGNGSPWTSSWGVQNPGDQFNPAPPPVDSGKRWRASWGEVAPGFPQHPAQPDRDSYKAWHNDWGEVPPLPAAPPAPPQPSRDGQSDFPPPAPRYYIPPDPAQGDRSSWAQNPGSFSPGSPFTQGDDSGRLRPNDGGVGRSAIGLSRDDVVNAFNQDLSTRSETSFNNTVACVKELAGGDEAGAKGLWNDWLAQQTTRNPLTFMRGAAELSEGLGAYILAEGSRMVDPNYPRNAPRILGGYGYDFGGEATKFLRQAAGCLVEAQTYVTGHKGMVVEGQAMDDDYLQQLNRLQTQVEDKLNVIYGPHDVMSVYGTIRNEVRIHSGEAQQELVSMQHKLDASRTTDNRFVAKSARDVALGYLAEADYMASQNNGLSARTMYIDARKYLGLALQRDPNAPDNLALRQICEGLRAQVNQAIYNHMHDSASNPFEIPLSQDDYV